MGIGDLTVKAVRAEFRGSWLARCSSLWLELELCAALGLQVWGTVLALEPRVPAALAVWEAQGVGT